MMSKENKNDNGLGGAELRADELSAVAGGDDELIEPKGSNWKATAVI